MKIIRSTLAAGLAAVFAVTLGASYAEFTRLSPPSTRLGDGLREVQVASDGSFAVYSANQKHQGVTDIFFARFDGTPPVKITPNRDAYYEASESTSDNNYEIVNDRWVVYLYGDYMESYRWWQLYSYDTVTGKTVRLNPQVYYQDHVDPEYMTVKVDSFWTTSDGAIVMRYEQLGRDFHAVSSVEGGASELPGRPLWLVNSEDSTDNRLYTSDGRIVFIGYDDDSYTISTYDPATQQTLLIDDLPPGESYNSAVYSISTGTIVLRGYDDEGGFYHYRIVKLDGSGVTTSTSDPFPPVTEDYPGYLRYHRTLDGVWTSQIVRADYNYSLQITGPSGIVTLPAVWAESSLSRYPMVFTFIPGTHRVLYRGNNGELLLYDLDAGGVATSVSGAMAPRGSAVLRDLSPDGKWAVMTGNIGSNFGGWVVSTPAAGAPKTYSYTTLAYDYSRTPYPWTTGVDGVALSNSSAKWFLDLSTGEETPLSQSILAYLPNGYTIETAEGLGRVLRKPGSPLAESIPYTGSSQPDYRVAPNGSFLIASGKRMNLGETFSQVTLSLPDRSDGTASYRLFIGVDNAWAYYELRSTTNGGPPELWRVPADGVGAAERICSIESQHGKYALDTKAGVLATAGADESTGLLSLSVYDLDAGAGALAPTVLASVPFVSLQNTRCELTAGAGIVIGWITSWSGYEDGDSKSVAWKKGIGTLARELDRIYVRDGEGITEDGRYVFGHLPDVVRQDYGQQSIFAAQEVDSGQVIPLSMSTTTSVHFDIYSAPGGQFAYFSDMESYGEERVYYARVIEGGHPMLNESLKAPNGYHWNWWHGWFFPYTGLNWMYHTTQGWQYVPPTGSGEWRYDAGLASWLWTNRDRFPWMYNDTLGWLYFETASSSPGRWFWQLNGNRWFKEGGQ